MLEKGQGVPKDLVSAHMWYNLAAARGDKRGEIYRHSIEKEMTAAQIAVAQRLAREWPNK
jgi:TPR repeat protein